MNINKNELSIKIEEVSQNYKHCVISYAGINFDNIILSRSNVCIIPFETDSTGKVIESLYLYKYYDFIKATSKVSTLMYKNNQEQDETNLDTVIRAIGDSLKIAITDSDISRVFYLGEIEMGVMLSGAIPCYAVNVTGQTKKDVVSYVLNDMMDITLEKYPYTTVLRGTSQDYLVASSVFMLLSYLS